MKATTKKVYCTAPQIGVVLRKIRNIELIYKANSIEEIVDDRKSTALKEAFKCINNKEDQYMLVGYIGFYKKDFNKEILEEKGKKVFIIDKDGEEFFCTKIIDAKNITENNTILNFADYLFRNSHNKELENFIIDKKFIQPGYISI